MWLEGRSPQNSNFWKIQLVTDPQMASEVLKFILDHFWFSYYFKSYEAQEVGLDPRKARLKIR